jgi:hypothetical protein
MVLLSIILPNAPPELVAAVIRPQSSDFYLMSTGSFTKEATCSFFKIATTCAT